MNGHQRITAVLNGEKPDRVPVMLHNFLMAAKEYGVTMEQYRNSPQVIADTFKSSVEKYRYDGILVDIDTVTLAGAAGVKVDFPVNEAARPLGANIHDLGSVFDLKPVNIADYKYVGIWLEAVRLLREYCKDAIFIRGNCDQAPFSLASMMRGTQNWMLDLMTGTDEQLTCLLEYCTDITSQFIRLMAQTGYQCHTFGLHFYLPVHGTAIYSTDSYTFRSGLGATAVLNWEVTGRNSEPVSAIQKRISDFKQMRPYYYADYYPLTQPVNNTRDDVWLAYQLNRPDRKDGIILAFRRSGNNEETIHVKLSGLEPASVYEISFEDYGIVVNKSGRELMEDLEITIPSKPASLMISYKAL